MSFLTDLKHVAQDAANAEVSAVAHAAVNTAAAAVPVLEHQVAAVSRDAVKQLQDRKAQLQQKYAEVAAQFGHVTHQLQEMQATADALRKQMVAFNVEFAQVAALEAK